jgi:hypothetical protein
MHLLLASVATIAALTLSPKFTPVPYLPVPRGAAVILDTGSTNSLGYRIVVQRNGDAEYVRGNARATGQISADLAKQFFSDLEGGMPLSKLQTAKCMKSASFGTSLFVWWRGQRSKDLSCPGEPLTTKIAADTQRIAVALNIAQPAMRTLPTNEPRRPMPEPSPSS